MNSVDPIMWSSMFMTLVVFAASCPMTGKKIGGLGPYEISLLDYAPSIGVSGRCKLEVAKFLK